jgi:hypothetical protein
MTTFDTDRPLDVSINDTTGRLLELDERVTPSA